MGREAVDPISLGFSTKAKLGLEPIIGIMSLAPPTLELIEGCMNRSWSLALPQQFTAAADFLSANLLGERAGEGAGQACGAVTKRSAGFPAGLRRSRTKGVICRDGSRNAGLETGAPT